MSIWKVWTRDRTVLYCKHTYTGGPACGMWKSRLQGNCRSVTLTESPHHHDTMLESAKKWTLKNDWHHILGKTDRHWALKLQLCHDATDYVSKKHLATFCRSCPDPPDMVWLISNSMRIIPKKKQKICRTWVIYLKMLFKFITFCSAQHRNVIHKLTPYCDRKAIELCKWYKYY